MPSRRLLVFVSLWLIVICGVAAVSAQGWIIPPPLTGTTPTSNGTVNITGPVGTTATVTTPQGVEVQITIGNPAGTTTIIDPGPRANGDPNLVRIRPGGNTTNIDTNGRRTEITLPNGTTIDVPGGADYGIDIEPQGDGRYRIETDPNNPSTPPIIVDPPGPGPNILLGPGDIGISGPDGFVRFTCTPGPSGVGVACLPA